MDRHQLDHLFGTFCRLDPDRCFSFDTSLSLLCHRCTSIYSTFLVISLFALAFRWRGQILQFRTRFAIGSLAIALLAICGAQVGLQEFFPPYGGGEQARIISGGLVALGLFLLSQVSKEGFPLIKGSLLQLFLLLGTIAFHLFLINISFIYNSVTTTLGLAWLYHQINSQVFENWLKDKPPVFRHGVIIVFILLEWGALYAINVMKIHV